MATYRQLLNGVDNALRRREHREQWTPSQSARMWSQRNAVQDELIAAGVLDHMPNRADRDIEALLRRVGGP
jgi:hypothetical protein